MRTKMNLDPDTGLVTQYSASQPKVSYASTWKCRVSNILSGLTQIEVTCHPMTQYQNKQRSNQLLSV